MLRLGGKPPRNGMLRHAAPLDAVCGIECFGCAQATFGAHSLSSKGLPSLNIA